MNNESTVRVGISHKFKERTDVFVRGKRYRAHDIIKKVQENGWFVSGCDNERRVRSAIREGILTGRIQNPERGIYIFKDEDGNNKNNNVDNNNEE